MVGDILPAHGKRHGGRRALDALQALPPFEQEGSDALLGAAATENHHMLLRNRKLMRGHFVHLAHHVGMALDQRHEARTLEAAETNLGEGIGVRPKRGSSERPRKSPGIANPTIWRRPSGRS